MTEVRLRPMPGAELAAWRSSRDAGGAPLPLAADGERLDAFVVEADRVDVGGALVGLAPDGPATRCVVRVLQTTLPRDAAEPWTAVATALEEQARASGASVVTAAIAPELAGFFARAGYQATMLSVAAELDPEARDAAYVEDLRVSVRPMNTDERRRFVTETADLMRDGMARAGVVDAGSEQLGALDQRLAALAEDPPPDGEMLMTAVVGGRPAGSAWGTLVPRDDGTDGIDFHGHALHLFPEFRGQGLSRSFLGALARHVDGLGGRDLHVRVYAFDQWARGTFAPTTETVADVHVRKDLR